MSLRAKLANFAKLAWDRRLAESVGGNMSVREGVLIHITPSACLKHFLTEDALLTLDLEGNVLSGNGRPSSEYRMHLRFYALCPDVTAVFHAHPIHATAFAIRGQVPPVGLVPETALHLDPITLLPYATPGTPDFANAFDAGLRNGSRVFMLRNHGVTTAGGTIDEAYARLESLEFLAKLALQVGPDADSLALSLKELEPFLAQYRHNS